MSFREKSNLNCYDLRQEYSNSKTFKGIVISNTDSYYVIGTEKDFKTNIKTDKSESLKRNLRLFYTKTKIKFPDVHNNLFMLEYFGREILGDVIIVKEDIQNLNETFHKNLGPMNKLFKAIKCDKCFNNLKYSNKAKLVGTKCGIALCSTSDLSNHTHNLCSFCFDSENFAFMSYVFSEMCNTESL
jgi:hypothetical protein